MCRMRSAGSASLLSMCGIICRSPTSLLSIALMHLFIYIIRQHEWYCSRECQLKAWKKHKPICQIISADMKAAKEEAARTKQEAESKKAPLVQEFFVEEPVVSNPKSIVIEDLSSSTIIEEPDIDCKI